MPAVYSQAYQLNPAVRLHWASWDDEYVVFDEGSGQTHQMDPVRAFILNMLCDDVQNFQNLLNELSSISSIADTSNLKDLLVKILNELGAQGLVEMAS